MTLTHASTHELTERIIGAAIEVHRHLGPGLLESTYEECLCFELEEALISVSRQPLLPVIYKGRKLHGCYRPDLVIENKVIVEIKTVEKLVDIHTAQVLTYIRHSNTKIGLLFNFNSKTLVEGMKRISL